MLLKQKTMKRTIAAIFAITLFACNMNYEKTPSGLAYKIYHGKGGDVKPKAGQFIKFNLSYVLKDRDSVLQDNYAKFPAYATLDTGAQTKYSFMEVVPLMNVGDSAEISISIDSLKNKGMIQEYSPILVKGQVLIAKVKLLQVFKDEKTMVADYEKTMEQEKNEELKALENYMAKNNLKGVKTKNGAYVIVENAGDITNKADSGKVATLMYRGYLENGKVFDTNMDTTKGHIDPIQIPVGKPGSIQGFSECLPYFGKGGKGKFLIPAMLGYGPQAQGTDVPAFSNLIFDIEVTDVANASANSGNQMMQQQMMEEMQRQQQQQQQQQQDSSNK
jgi:FKBP-type peptidyl-prolyl cis-trans isomerase FkpA